jgi:hypothetical protein
MFPGFVLETIRNCGSNSDTSGIRNAGSWNSNANTKPGNTDTNTNAD